MNNGMIEKLLLSRRKLIEKLQFLNPLTKERKKVGAVSLVFAPLNRLLHVTFTKPSRQMHNRGNGKAAELPL